MPSTSATIPDGAGAASAGLAKSGERYEAMTYGNARRGLLASPAQTIALSTRDLSGSNSATLSFPGPHPL